MDAVALPAAVSSATPKQARRRIAGPDESATTAAPTPAAFLTAADRVQLTLAALNESWSGLGWSVADVAGRTGEAIPTARLEQLRTGSAAPSPQEVSVLVGVFGLDRIEFDQRVRAGLLRLLDRRAGSHASLFPHIHINVDLLLADPDQTLGPAKGLLVAHLGGPGRSSSEMLVGPDLVRSLAQVCGIDALACWLLLCRYIDQDH